ncbi:MAG TPA: metallophosphoesterase [Candidatus Sulfotelmatobacter sp.]|nr:metallophosphoesterase [Candidatus Sulfotelmatobacter sp.]
MVSFPGLCRRVVRHWRGIVTLLIVARAAFYLIYPDEFGRFFDLIFLALFVVFIAGQIFWIKRIIDGAMHFIPSRIGRARPAVIAVLIYLFVYALSYPGIQSTNEHIFRTNYDRSLTIVAEALFWWWFVGSMLAFFLVLVFAAGGYAARAVTWIYTKMRDATRQHPSPEIATPAWHTRRHFLKQSAVLVSATPFFAAGYGFFYGRQNVEVVRHRVRLARLPKSFDGIRIAQLSDIHMGPFATEDYVRRCVAITNGLKPDLIALTGDYIAWDPGLERRVVSVLASLRAPHGVFACLGNHEEESETEEYVSALFTAQGIRILRQERAPIRLGGDELNLIGIDCPSGEDEEEEYRRDINRRLHQQLVISGTVNVLLSHEPSVFVFDRAADLGIDLILAGHTHGGQLAFDFAHRGLNLSDMFYRYTSGWYEQRSTKLYVNRGIGTTGFPIRLGARPEITILELVRT